MEYENLKSISDGMAIIGALLVFVGMISGAVIDRKLKSIKPLLDTISLGSGIVEITVTDGEDELTTISTGSYIVFENKGNAIMTMGTTTTRAYPLEDGNFVYRAEVNLDPKDNSIGKPIYTLAESDIIRIKFLYMKLPNSILAGNIHLTINGTFRITIDIPKQETESGEITVENASDILQNLRIN